MIPRISFFASTGYLLVHRRGHIVYYVVEFKTIILTLNKFLFINLITTTRDNVTETECRG